ncbi:MAG: endolytic transglycosylase MltG [Candidatus Marinimicrobia bacterium]|nr:endolytic transglycosylase MltG [Candidatus Neomarinimicrobiota bacterium]MCF7828642.1 endolytic transglycosylase MltG [Candidatus Neomarinimicrobiota bacterium]MCF7880383.1 endolytic transglycosylase MltG [Candidatus Neomarinimicrobiota bacterium]
MGKILIKHRAWFLGAAGILLLTVFLFFDILYRVPWGPQTGEDVRINIQPGSSLSSISDSLYSNDVIPSRDAFEFAVRLRGLETDLQAGVFGVEKNASYRSIIYSLTHNTPEIVNVTIIEGLQSREIARILEKKILLTAEEFNAVVADSALAADLGIPGPTLEGFLFPETYKFFLNESAESVARKMVEHYQAVVPDSFAERAREAYGWTMWEAVTLASIIEGEAVYDSERAQISSVYHNRLRQGMRLQADPTIQFIIEDGPRRLWSRDLEIESPYNTYRNAGLPPGPINNPGFESIKAALYPADTDYLYFVARGDGYHTFTRTNREHVNAKRRLQRLRRQVGTQ